MKQGLADLKGDISFNTVFLGGFSIALPSMDRSVRTNSSTKKSEIIVIEQMNIN